MSQQAEIHESEKKAIVVLQTHADGSPYHELAHRQVYDVETFEELSKPDGFFDAHKVKIEILHDVREEAKKEAELAAAKKAEEEKAEAARIAKEEAEAKKAAKKAEEEAAKKATEETKKA